MILYSLRYSQQAKERIRCLPPQVKSGVKKSLEGLQQDPYQGKTLKRELTGFWSLRFKTYRIIYKIDVSKKKIEVYSLGLRKNIYEEVSHSLKTGSSV